ncbi:unnamed protein product [Aphis gossypii]|uniref:Uncharacterized protein n=1 Tax=Aphis gossypii TaxID=80765 RepID=A0A9P0ND87_APHGO|nr:unnamed protein product [Aphis gossypii]
MLFTLCFGNISSGIYSIIKVKEIVRVKIKIHSIWKRKPNLTMDILAIKQQNTHSPGAQSSVYETQHSHTRQRLLLQYRSTLLFHISIELETNSRRVNYIGCCLLLLAIVPSAMKFTEHPPSPTSGNKLSPPTFCRISAVELDRPFCSFRLYKYVNILYISNTSTNKNRI